eukprot:4774561-Pleurochrysis_carterae.AAC.1
MANGIGNNGLSNGMGNSGMGFGSGLLGGSGLLEGGMPQPKDGAATLVSATLHAAAARARARPRYAKLTGSRFVDCVESQS